MCVNYCSETSFSMAIDSTVANWYYETTILTWYCIGIPRKITIWLENDGFYYGFYCSFIVCMIEIKTAPCPIISAEI